MFEVDVIIPVYKPTEKFSKLLDMLEAQSLPIGKIILVNTEKNYFDRFAAGTDFEAKHKKLLVTHITKEEFDHGKTRNYGVSLSDAPWFVMMTDDARPADRELLKNLLEPFQDEKVGMSYARQIPDEGCGVIESYTRSFNYPDRSGVKSREDLESMGIKAFFASNVCAAYKREIFDLLGGFKEHTNFNEDMIYARGLINAGYKIAYAAGAKVIHSHNYSGAGQFRRNFDLGVSHADNPQVFSDIRAESEGMRLVKRTCGYLCRIGKPWLIFRLFWQSGCKYMGYYLGKRYRSIPRGIVKLFSMNRDYWR